jgi:hypothetical protein
MASRGKKKKGTRTSKPKPKEKQNMGTLGIDLDEILKDNPGYSREQIENAIANIPKNPVPAGETTTPPAPADPTEQPSSPVVPPPEDNPLQERLMAVEQIRLTAWALDKLGQAMLPQRPTADGEPDLAVNAPVLEQLLNFTNSGFKNLASALTVAKKALG